MVRNNSNISDKYRLGALVLAAGYSSRMGAFKPLLRIGDTTAMERILALLKASDIQRPLVVTGHNKEALELLLRRNKADYIFNENYAEGMFTSIQKGLLRMVSDPSVEYSGFLLMLSDCPLIPPEVIRLLAQKHRENPESFIVPCYKGKKGHPLLIPARYVQEILFYGGDGGLKAITSKYEENMIKLEVEQEAVLLDMDTPAGYEELLRYDERSKSRVGRKEHSWKELLDGRRVFLVRHGQIRQHREKIFLGQADIPLSDKGRSQAQAAGEILRGHALIKPVIHASDLDRVVETANIIIDTLGGEEPVPCMYHENLREMSLGEWDGRYIREIKDTYPEEYRKRGEAILTYKFGHYSENFYDLQYRVMKCFRNIVEQERALDLHQDIIMVSHTGVMKVLLSNLYDRPLCEEMKRIIPNGEVLVVSL